MKKYLLVLAGLYCVLSYALAEHPDYPELKKSDANIIGHVLDKKTKEHLPYITIALKGTTIGTVTDATGHYFLKNLPEGNFILEVSSVGYKTVTRNVTLKKGKTLNTGRESIKICVYGPSSPLMRTCWKPQFWQFVSTRTPG